MSEPNNKEPKKIPQDYALDEYMNVDEIADPYKYRESVYLIRISNQLSSILNHLDFGVETWSQSD